LLKVVVVSRHMIGGGEWYLTVV